MSLWEGEQPNRIVTLYGNYIDLILCYHKNIFYGPFKYFFYNLRFFIILNMNGHVFWIRPSLITSLGVKVIKKKKKKKDNLFYFTRTIWDGTIANSFHWSSDLSHTLIGAQTSVASPFFDWAPPTSNLKLRDQTKQHGSQGLSSVFFLFKIRKTKTFMQLWSTRGQI